MPRFDTFLASLVVCLSAALAGCAAGGAGWGSREPVTRLYADPGVGVEQPSGHPVPYQPGMRLHTGDAIETGSGYAVVDFGGGNIVDLSQRTRIELGSIRLFFGELFARLSKIVRRGSGEVSTDELSASVEGTEYDVRRMPTPGKPISGITSVIVRRGKVLCAPAGSGAWAPVTVTENRILRAEGTHLVGKLQYVDALAQTRWADEVERRLLHPRRPAFELLFPITPYPLHHPGRSKPTPSQPGSKPTPPQPSPPEGAHDYPVRDQPYRPVLQPESSTSNDVR